MKLYQQQQQIVYISIISNNILQKVYGNAVYVEKPKEYVNHEINNEHNSVIGNYNTEDVHKEELEEQLKLSKDKLRILTDSVQQTKTEADEKMKQQINEVTTLRQTVLSLSKENNKLKSSSTSSKTSSSSNNTNKENILFFQQIGERLDTLYESSINILKQFWKYITKQHLYKKYVSNLNKYSEPLQGIQNKAINAGKQVYETLEPQVKQFAKYAQPVTEHIYKQAQDVSTKAYDMGSKHVQKHAQPYIDEYNAKGSKMFIEYAHRQRYWIHTVERQTAISLRRYGLPTNAAKVIAKVLLLLVVFLSTAMLSLGILRFVFAIQYFMCYCKTNRQNKRQLNSNNEQKQDFIVPQTDTIYSRGSRSSMPGNTSIHPSANSFMNESKHSSYRDSSVGGTSRDSSISSGIHMDYNRKDNTSSVYRRK